MRPGGGGYNLWNAPAAINDICGSSGPGGYCQGSDYLTNVQSVLPCPGSGPYATDCAPILTDIEQCNLQPVSWVIPDGNWSDHAGGPQGENGDGGPSWVANIVNAVGNSCGYWNNTVIFVVWDDWGGHYDDVVPPDCTTNPCTGYLGGENGNGQQYVYGFRVPLLVIGAYTKAVTPSGGYISGPRSNYSCPGPYCHDFGSILNFIEYAFGLTQGGIGDTHWPYADALAMDAPPTCNSCTYSLSDFFTFTQANFHPFQPITPLEYSEDCFHHPNDAGCFQNYYPQSSDNDDNED